MDLFKKLMIQHFIDFKKGAYSILWELIEIIHCIFRAVVLGIVFSILAFIITVVFVGGLSLIYLFGAFVYNLIFNIYSQLT